MLKGAASQQALAHSAVEKLHRGSRLAHEELRLQPPPQPPEPPPAPGSSAPPPPSPSLHATAPHASAGPSSPPWPRSWPAAPGLPPWAEPEEVQAHASMLGLELRLMTGRLGAARARRGR